MEKPYDIVVYGASGFTGQYAAAEMVRTCIGKKMAIGGRSKTKLMDTLKFIKKEVKEIDETTIGIIIADNSDEDSIMEMCRQSKAVVNCVGPFRWYGEMVVRCCVKMSSHYVDISGEPEFLQMCQIKYHDEALAKGIHIVGMKLITGCLPCMGFPLRLFLFVLSPSRRCFGSWRGYSVLLLREKHGQ